MFLRSRSLALFGVVLYGAAAFALPFLHLWNHRYDHRHGSGGTVCEIQVPDEVHEEHLHVDVAHADFESDLIALGLIDVTGTALAVVDCDLTAYTLASCEETSAGSHHTFGDELLARLSRHGHRRAFDPEHGAGSLLHFGLAFLAPSTFLVPPPADPSISLPLPFVSTLVPASPARSLRARGPPSHAVL